MKRMLSRFGPDGRWFSSQLPAEVPGLVGYVHMADCRARPWRCAVKPTVDRDLCIGCGNCESVCPEVFLLADDGIAMVLVENVGEEYYECTRDAQDGCPVSAISIQE